MKLGNPVILLSVVVTLAGCAAGERYETRRPAVKRPPPREVYATTSSLPASALRSWDEASRRALRSRLSIAPSFRERVRFPEHEPYAVAYRFPLVRGQVLRVQVTRIDAQADLFSDMFHALGGGVFRPVQPVAQSPDGLVFEARADGEYVLRLQPPMHRGGLYDVTVLGNATLRFPVADAGLSSIGGVFGDARDGGVRSHEGVDIFAPRGTPVVAAADGTIRQARNTPTGGLVIWQADATSELTYYYAHLDELLVHPGARVRAGDTIGTVGTTGNARGTRPHLHFGVYRPGTIALDPAPLLAGSTEPLNDLRTSTRRLGEWSHVSGSGVRLRSSPSLAGAVIAELAPATPLLILGDSGEWQRVVLEDGRTGFIAARYTDAGYGSR
jgi:murein DD-endopeptidase MepM/ murein hydrolase activator NlpD